MAADGVPLELAVHWLGAGDDARARAALRRAAAESEAIRAYRDAANAARQALELWPAGEDDEGRIETLERTPSAPSWSVSWPMRRKRGASWQR